MKYDIIIVGSGLGGLLCAYMLGKEGYSVCVLEKNKQLGGNLQTFTRDKCIFDTGIHYIGGLDEGQNLNQFFKYFNILDKLKMKRMDGEAFDVISFGNDDKSYSFAQGYERFYESLVEQFPGDKAAIKSYCEMLRTSPDEFPLYHLNLDNKNGNGPFNLGTELLRKNTKDYIDELTDNEKLRSVLAGNNLLYAGDPNATPLYVHSLILNTYIESSYRMVNGGSQIAKYLAKNIRANGGKLINHSEVTNFIFKGNEISAVETKNGERIEGKYFISNIHPSVTLKMIDKDKLRAAYRNRIANIENTPSVFTLYGVLEPDSFEYLNSNYYHYRSEEVWTSLNYNIEDWPASYLFLTPASTKSEKFADCYTAMTCMQFKDVEKWKDTYNTVGYDEDRGESYKDFKEVHSQNLLNEIEKKFPGIKSKTKSYYSSTPLSYRDYIGTVDGSAYGILRDYKSPLKSFIPTNTKIPNLFLTGQNTHMHGVLGVTISAVLTVAAFVGLEYLVKKIKSA